MAFSEMNSREKTIIAVLGIVIVIALIGIGFLVAKLISDNGASESTEAISVSSTEPVQAEPEPTFTLVATASLEGMEEAAPVAVSEQPVAVAQAQALGPGLPVMLVNQPLSGDHVYRLEISAADGSKAGISGSWSQAASGSGQVEMDVTKPIEGTTPFGVEIEAPMPNPSLWSLSVSAGPKNLLGDNPALVITLWDVTGEK